MRDELGFNRQEMGTRILQVDEQRGGPGGDGSETAECVRLF